LHGAAPHPSTFQLFGRSYSPVPVACDFVFVSADLADKVQKIEVDLKTQASDHQPVLLSL
jgi:endonuclease/exonuclease/phosphatase family metal-dependent hydrolase